MAVLYIESGLNYRFITHACSTVAAFFVHRPLRIDGAGQTADTEMPCIRACIYFVIEQRRLTGD